MSGASRGVRDFAAQGYFLARGFFPPGRLDAIRDTVLEANEAWIRHNRGPHSDRVVNSAYLTHPRYLPDPARRLALFRFIAEGDLVALAAQVLEAPARFVNTQLFFNPESQERLPYWHRDIQYSGLPEERQRERILIDKWLHFRVPLFPDPGVEFIPGSHRRWDTPEELEVRLELHGKRQHQDLPGMVRVPQEPGDLLVFSAHLIHRGVYGGGRKSLDILFSDQGPPAEDQEAKACGPDTTLLESLPNRGIFLP